MEFPNSETRFWLAIPLLPRLCHQQFNSLLVGNPRVMFITKAYSPNSRRFKRVPHDNSVSKRDVSKVPSKPAQERVTSHSEAQENDSRTREESIQGRKHRSPHPPGLSIHSPIELDDDIDNEDHERVSKSSVVSPGGFVGRLQGILR